MQFVEPRGQDLPGSLLGFIDHPTDFLVDYLGCRIGNILALRDRMSEEHLLLVLGVAQRPEFLAEPEFSDHAPRQTGRATDVVGRPRRNLVWPEDQLFGD